jgi:hypothetical protein
MNYLLALFLLLMTHSLDADSPNSASDYQHISNVSEYIATERQAAINEEQKLLWVLGSDWCHDSRSLASKLKSAELAEILKSDYRVSMIDVGYLESGFEFANIANMQAFYATPTVFIIDPVGMTHLNADDMHIWANAYQVSQADTNAYFRKYQSVTESKSSAYNPKQQVLQTELDNYVAEQEQRILAAYQVVGPLLAKYKAGKTDPNFESYWNTLAKLRMALPDTIAKNKAIIMSGGGNEPLELPENTAFPWEE